MTQEMLWTELSTQELNKRILTITKLHVSDKCGVYDMTSKRLGKFRRKAGKLQVQRLNDPAWWDVVILECHGRAFV